MSGRQKQRHRKPSIRNAMGDDDRWMRKGHEIKRSSKYPKLCECKGLDPDCLRCYGEGEHYE